MNNTAFGRIETCACCGKDVKKPVFSKRLGAHFGKDCFEAIRVARQTASLCGDAKAIAETRAYYPRTWERIAALAGIKVAQ